MEALLLVGFLLIQEYQHPDVEDPYKGWKQESGASCCNAKDCAPVIPCRPPGSPHKEGWLEFGRCWELDPEKETLPPPEVWSLGELHVCRQPTYYNGELTGMLVYCWASARSV